MTSLNPRHSFTPQRSPSMPSSQASQSPPASEGEAAELVSTTVAQGSAEIESLSRKADEGELGKAASSGSGNANINHAVLNCWTAHQSHGQVTILFYVPRWTKKEDLQIIFGSDYVIAGVRSAKGMVVQAQLAGRINVSTSTWQLEKQSNKRSRSRSRSRLRVKKMGTGSGHHSSTESSNSSGPEQKPVSSDLALKRAEGQRTGSPAESDGASSFDLLARSTDTLESSGGWESNWNQSPIPSHSHLTGTNSPLASPPRGLDQSMTLSEESGYLPSGFTSGGEGGVRSLESSISIDHSHGESSASRARSEDDAITDAKLVTLHLDKVDGGIWPFLVSGPASLSLLSSDAANKLPFVLHSAHRSLDAALTEALEQQTSGQGDYGADVSHDEEDALEHSFSQSTATIDTISSDESTTVLGARGSSEDNLYDMDPTSLALMGIRLVKQGHRSPFGSTSTQEESKAFEYFKRAWRKAEIPLATKRLVEDYLPLPSHQHHNSMLPFRSRMTASLGGPSALARLYVSYARLDLPSFQDRQSPLAFPLGGLTNPFGGGHGHTHDHLSSPRSQGEQSIGPDALTYLREARIIDKNVVISAEEWHEAQSMAAQSPSSEKAWRWENSDGAHRASGESEKASQGRQSSSKSHKRSHKKTTKKSTGSRRHRDDLGRSSEKFSSEPGLVFILVSRAALLSVMVAGGVAVAGWWRRAAAAGGGGGS